MKKYNPITVKNCYDLTAKQYSKMFLHELDNKPLDRYMLKRFSESFHKDDQILDFGCGSGHITKYIYDLGYHNITGLDFSEKAIIHAKEVFPEVRYEVDNMLASKFPGNSIHGIVAFYAIVHFTYKEIQAALIEWERLLLGNGKLLFSFHIGKGSKTVKRFLDVEEAGATWNFFEVDKVIQLIKNTNLVIDEVVVRYPYENAEHPSKRCYILAAKKK